jgi:hypothetical protein
MAHQESCAPITLIWLQPLMAGLKAVRVLIEQ